MRQHDAAQTRDGARLGVQLDRALLLDQRNFGLLPNATAQPTWDLDLHGAPFTVGPDSHANMFVTSGR